jgi:hypothetical protein
MSEAAELIVTLRGADVGLSALLRKIESDLAKSDRATVAAEQSAVKLAGAHVRLAGAAERLGQAQMNTATSAQRLAQTTAQAEAAQSRAAVAALRLEQAQARVAQAATNSGIGALPRTFAGLTTEMQSAATGMLSFGAALGVAASVAQSFADAFTFKAQLDATTTSVNAQLKGVRDSGQVWSEASAFAQTYKLTQQETTEAISASIGVMRASKAPIEDVLGVLARMQVLSPEQSLQEAAIALKALASGDTTSLTTRFEVGRDVANQMKAEILGGADAVAVMSKFLGDTGIGMDVLAAKTTGAAGAIKDAAIASEQLKLAQAEFANGPGLAILQAQIEITRGATRALSGDWQAMGSALGTALADPVGPLTLLAGTLGITQAQAQAYAAQIRDTDAAQQDATSGGSQWAAATQQVTSAVDVAAQALAAQTAAIQADAGEALINEANTKVLSQAKLDLAAQAQAAANGVLTSGANINAEAARLAASSSLVDQLTAAYLRLAVASGQAQAAADKAAGQDRLAAGRTQTRDLSGSIGFNAPGRKGNDDVLGTIKATQATILQEEKKSQTARVATAKSGGGARVATEQKSQQQLASTVQDYQAKIAQIEQDGLSKRRDAENSLRQAQLSGRAGFYASLANIDDGALRADLSSRYEQAAQAASAIAQTQGADAAQAYLEASQQAIQGESAIQGQIADAKKEGNDGQAAYLEGVLQLQRAANAEELRQIQEKGSAVANAQAAQYAQAESQYAEHLDRMGAIAAAKGVSLSSAVPVAPGGTATAAPTKSGAQVVEDVATPPAIDAMNGSLGSKLDAVVAAVRDVSSRVGAVETAVNGLKRSGAFAGG